MNKKGNQFNTIIMVIIGALLVSVILAGLKTTALKNAYDNTNAYTITDTAGTVHNVSASGISGDTVALLYSLAGGLVWLFAIIVIVFSLIKLKK